MIITFWLNKGKINQTYLIDIFLIYKNLDNIVIENAIWVN
jgi:hypothetical protein